MSPLLIRILVGLIFGLMAMLLGIYSGLKHVQEVRERKIVIRTTIAWGCATAIFSILLYSLPNPYRFLVWIPYLSTMVLIFGAAKLALKRIRLEEAQSQKKPPHG